MMMIKYDEVIEQTDYNSGDIINKIFIENDT